MNKQWNGFSLRFILTRGKKKLLELFNMFSLEKLLCFCWSKIINGGFSQISIVFFPRNNAVLFCGLCSIVAIKKTNYNKTDFDIRFLIKIAKRLTSNTNFLKSKNISKVKNEYLGGQKLLILLFDKVRAFREEDFFLELLKNKKKQKQILSLLAILTITFKQEKKLFGSLEGDLDPGNAREIVSNLAILEDVIWCLDKELMCNLKKVENILPKIKNSNENQLISIFKQINTVLNSIDRLEVRGRDSAGISVFFIISMDIFKKIKKKLIQTNLMNEFVKRQSYNLLIHKSIHYNTFRSSMQSKVAITITYKIALEVGNLGDNSNFLRGEIKNDKIFHSLASAPLLYYTISSHTRWASVGAITEPNCHPIDNIVNKFFVRKKWIIHVCLNGEIDNYLELKNECKLKGIHIPKEITTDTKIIPLKIEEYLDKGHNIYNSFRLAVNSFSGSHAITMHTDVAPGKLFVAHKGSGQSMFIGLSENYYIPTSEIYGFVEETNKFLRMEGDKVIKGKDGNDVQGQIFILDQKSQGRIDDIEAFYYDGTEIKFGKNNVKYTDITTKDIDRKGFKHYFLKEIYEAPSSVEVTLNGKWDLSQSKDKDGYYLKKTKNILPKKVVTAFKRKAINKIFFIGQGTAGIAAKACSDILNYFLYKSDIRVSSLRASEFSGFELKKQDNNKSLSNTLVVAVSQSGTTADTNRAIDMALERNAYTLAIVNRRDSDITFKVEGIIYTSSGRDLEMSVASTKAFYSQITAGTLLGLNITSLIKARTEIFISKQIEELLKLPKQMLRVLDKEEYIKKSALKLAATKQYWSVVGSGPNKVSADEIRIKLSELCYKSISSDFVEDKKHIDLSSEPLILICVAGSNDEVIGDIIKDAAIFKAHKAISLVIDYEREKRFEPYAENVFYVPRTVNYLAPILNTLVGHIWGYYAALAINKASTFLDDFRKKIRNIIDEYTLKGFYAFEIIREKSFRSKINNFYFDMRRRVKNDDFPMRITNLTDLTLLLKYLSGKLPISDFEIDFDKKGTAVEIIHSFFKVIEKSIKDMSRPVDAIKHQAKTVTVGTSRISSKVNGILFEAINSHGIVMSQLANKNIIVIKNLQKVIRQIHGSVLYVINKLDSLGEPDAVTEIEIQNKSGTLESRYSRVENDKELKGIKRIIVSRGDVYVGKGRENSQNIIIPICSDIPKESNKIRYLLLLNVKYKKKLPLEIKIKALGGKYDNIKNIVNENSIVWNDKYIDTMDIDDLFGFSAEKVGEHIVLQQNGDPIHIV